MNLRLAPFLQVKVSVFNSAGGVSFWNYATDTLSMAIMQVTTSCIYAGFEVVPFVTGMLVDFSVAIKQVTVSVAIMRLGVSGAHMQVTVSAAKMWFTNFVVILL